MNSKTQKNEEMKSMMLLCFATYVGLYGFAPSVKELSVMTGIRPGRLVDRFLKDLKAEGMIRDDYRPRLQAV